MALVMGTLLWFKGKLYVLPQKLIFVFSPFSIGNYNLSAHSHARLHVLCNSWYLWLSLQKAFQVLNCDTFAWVQWKGSICRVWGDLQRLAGFQQRAHQNTPLQQLPCQALRDRSTGWKDLRIFALDLSTGSLKHMQTAKYTSGLVMLSDHPWTKDV